MGKKQVYVKMDGRLGNQMFQYAFGRQMQEITGGELVLDFTSHKINVSAGIYGTDGICNSLVHFNLQPYTYVDLGNYDAKRIPFIQRKLFQIARFVKPMTKRQWWIEIFEFFDHFILQLFGVYFLESSNAVKYLHWPSKSKKNIFIRSWGESDKYFNGIKDKLREEFKPIYPVPEEHKPLFDKLQNTQSICVTVRRGDFIKSTFSNRYLVCDKPYYKRGVDYIKTQIGDDALVFVCSDDVEWCKQNLLFGENVIFEPEGLEIWDKIRFMSACHHFVISNSTFSWWCQYLSPYKDKIVVAPKVWRNVKPTPRDIYQDNWVTM